MNVFLTYLTDQVKDINQTLGNLIDTLDALNPSNSSTFSSDLHVMTTDATKLTSQLSELTLSPSQFAGVMYNMFSNLARNIKAPYTKVTNVTMDAAIKTLYSIARLNMSSTSKNKNIGVIYFKISTLAGNLEGHSNPSEVPSKKNFDNKCETLNEIAQLYKQEI